MTTDFRLTQVSQPIVLRALHHGLEQETGLTLEKGFAQVASWGSGAQPSPWIPGHCSLHVTALKAPAWGSDGPACVLSDSPIQPSWLASGWEGGSG